MRCRLLVVTITVMSHKRGSVSNHRQLDCLFNRLFRLAPNKTSNPALLTLYDGNPWVIDGFPEQWRGKSIMSRRFHDCVHMKQRCGLDIWRVDKYIPMNCNRRLQTCQNLPIWWSINEVTVVQISTYFQTWWRHQWLHWHYNLHAKSYTHGTPAHKVYWSYL